MVALKRAGLGMQLLAYIGMAALFVLGAVACIVIFLMASVTAYGALCLGMKGAATLVFGAGCIPLAGLCVLAAAFWQQHRRERIQAALGTPL